MKNYVHLLELEILFFYFGFAITEIIRLDIFYFLPWWFPFIISVCSVFILEQIMNWAITEKPQIHPRHWVILITSHQVNISSCDLDIIPKDSYIKYLADWCQKNCRGNWMHNDYFFFFNRKADASLFILFHKQ